MAAPDKSGAIKGGLQGRHCSQISGQEQRRELVRQNFQNPEKGCFFFIEDSNLKMNEIILITLVPLQNKYFNLDFS